jgi:hypothetical protein
MRIKSWELKLTWEDGTENDVSCNVSVYIVKAIEEFCDYWEEKYGEEGEEGEETQTDDDNE